MAGVGVGEQLKTATGGDGFVHRAGVDGEEAVALLDGCLDSGGGNGRVQPHLPVFSHRRAAPQAGKLAVLMKTNPARAGRFRFRTMDGSQLLQAMPKLSFTWR